MHSVASALSQAGRSTRWLAAASGIELGELESRLAARSDFTVTEIGDIAAALGITGADLIPPRR